MTSLRVTGPQSGKTLLAVLRHRYPQATARVLIEQGRVRVGKGVCFDPGHRVRCGQRVQVQEEVKEPREAKAAPPRQRGPKLDIRYADAHVVVVEKPAGLTTMRHPDEAAEFGERGRRFLPPTLLDLLPDQLAARFKGRPPRLRAVHRLDNQTSGLVVFACTQAAETELGKQFRGHKVERRYLGLVRGQIDNRRIESSLVDDRGDGRRGSSRTPGLGKRAITNVRVIQRLGEFTLVECRLETGRTHQVRIHLGEAGAPLCGERIYDRPLHGKPIPDNSGAARPMLHAAGLGFIHPTTGKSMNWESPLPADFRKLVDRLAAST